LAPGVHRSGQAFFLPPDGRFAAVERIGVVLSEQFPRSAADINEIPDKLIEL